MKEKTNKYIRRFKHTRQTIDPTDKRLKIFDINFVKTLSRNIGSVHGIHEYSKYIAEKAVLVAAGINLNVKEIEDIFYAGFLIQLGKVALPKNLREKPFFNVYCR